MPNSQIAIGLFSSMLQVALVCNSMCRSGVPCAWSGVQVPACALYFSLSIEYSHCVVDESAMCLGCGWL